MSSELISMIRMRHILGPSYKSQIVQMKLSLVIPIGNWEHALTYNLRCATIGGIRSSYIVLLL